MIVIIDNYDSFSYNLYQLIGVLEPDIQVIRNDAIEVPELAELHPSAIILSPGPGTPDDAGICEEVVTKFSGHVPILGVCLGHQAICEAFGAKIVHASQVMHGKTSQVTFTGDSPLFKGIPEPCTVGRYHSLAVDPSTLPDCLQAIARTRMGEVMAVQHVQDPTYGMQFHPESVLTPNGKQMLQNFITICKEFNAHKAQ
jgi:anthranilate synthase component 2